MAEKEGELRQGAAGFHKEADAVSHGLMQDWSLLIREKQFFEQVDHELNRQVTGPFGFRI